MPGREPGHELFRDAVSLMLVSIPFMNRGGGLERNGSSPLLLGHMGQLVRKEALPAGGAGSQLSGSEEDVHTGRECPRTQGPGLLGSWVYAHLREVVPQESPVAAHRARRKGLTGGVSGDVIPQSRRVRGTPAACRCLWSHTGNRLAFVGRVGARCESAHGSLRVRVT